MRRCVIDLPYSAGLMSQSFWFQEFRQILRLWADGNDDESLKNMCSEQSFFGTVNAYRAKRMCGYLLRRKNNLDEEMVDLFLHADMTTQKLINLVAITRGDHLFFDFLNEVYREKALLGMLELNYADVNAFFTRKGSESSIVNGWNDSTVKHLRSSYLDFMGSANLLSGTKDNRHITTPVIEMALERKLLNDGDDSILKAIGGRR